MRKRRKYHAEGSIEKKEKVNENKEIQFYYEERKKLNESTRKHYELITAIVYT